MHTIETFRSKWKRAAVLCAFLFAASAAPCLHAGALQNGEDDDRPIRRVLLISIDGMHALDFINCSKGISGVNGGDPYCPQLALLKQTGVSYLDASASRPSDSFPGLMALVSGGSPRTVGAFYDVAYDRSLDPPAKDTGNGVTAGACTAGAPPTGTRTEYEEGIDLDQTKLNGGAPSGDGGINSIDPSKLIRDPANNCAPVYPWNFVRTNTIFGVIHAAGGYTVWSDKHPAYSSVSGPGNGGNLDDYYSPEINSIPVGLPGIKGCDPLPDQTAVAASNAWTDSFQNIRCYDTLKVNAILNQISGKTHDGRPAQVPDIFGMNFQAVSVAQKLIEKSVGETGGYVDGEGRPTPALLKAIQFVDAAIGEMVDLLEDNGLLKSTLIVISAKHGQSPIDPNRFFPIPGHSGSNGQAPSSIVASLLPDSEVNQIGPTEDDISLLWLTDSDQTSNAVSLLEKNATQAGIGEIFTGPAISQLFDLPGLPPNGDPRTPDIIITSNVGVVYTGSTKKLAEHGGFAHDDINVMMLLSNPRFRHKTVTSPVETTQVAPTILKALGLDPNNLKSVRLEHTQVLPGLRFR
jgi:hypothetical protein